MSQDHSAALLGTAEIATHGSHDAAELEDPELGRVTTSREATQAPATEAMETSQHLESSQMLSGSTTLSTDPSASSPFVDHEQRVSDVEPEKHDKDKPHVKPAAPDLQKPSTIAALVKEKNLSPGVGPPPLLVVPPFACDTLSRTPHSPPTPTQGDSQPQSQNPHHQPSTQFVPLHETNDGAADSHDGTPEGKMIFGNHTAVNAAQRRRNYANTNALTDYEADLTSRDRAKQKEAVKKFLGERVKQDWTFQWPRSDSSAPVEPSSPSPQLPESPITPITEEHVVNEEQWKERDEWLSNASDSGDDRPMPTSATSPDTPSTRHSIFQFESPDSVGDTIKKTQYERKRRRKRRLADEMTWNEGLRCFTARRNAWTGARRVPTSRLQALALRAQRGSLSTEGSSTAIEQEEDEEWEDDIEIPIAPPILPPENAMRASIQPGAYHTIYDKVVVQQLTPSCPMNLKDVTRSCVQGWKRDGEWPPKATPLETKRKSRKMSVASLFGLEKQKTREEKPKEKEKEKEHVEVGEKKSGGIRKSLQKMLSLGHKESREKLQGAN